MFAFRHTFGGVLAAVALSGVAVAQDIDLETRLGEEGFESPAADLEQVDWLVGQWVGEGIGGAPAMESWLPPIGGTMVGTFVQQTAEGPIQFTEHLYLMEEQGSLVLRLKHFNADLTGWEAQDGMLTFRLVALEPCAAYFHALTLRCSDPARPGAGLIAAVRMQTAGPEAKELLFRFDPMNTEPARSYECDGTTLQHNECLGQILERAEERQQDYLGAALAARADTAELAEMIRQSQAAAVEYRDRECLATYQFWIEGSIRNSMALACRIRMTDERTHDIWTNWLTYPDATPPILPEPLPTRHALASLRDAEGDAAIQ